MVATPNVTFTVTPPGGSAVDYTARLGWSGVQTTPSISQHFGRQGDTASFGLIDEYGTAPNFHIPVFSAVKLVDNTTGTTLFAGVADDPVQLWDGPNRNEWSLKCTDYTLYADAAIVHGTFIGWTVDQIVVALTKQANCGISAATTANGGFVAPGPQLGDVVINYTTLSNAWRRLAQLAAQSTPYGWYVDEQLRLHFYDATTAISSGVTFTTSPTTSGSLTEGHISTDSFSYEWDGASVRNRILVQGAKQTVIHGPVATTAPTDTWRSNGVQTAWPLRYTVTGSPTLRINGTPTTVNVVTAGSTSSATWQIVQNSVGTWFLTTTGQAPAEGVTIKIWYSYQVPVVAQANDYASQAAYNGPNGGIFTEYINDSTLTTMPMALARAMRQRTEYSIAAERMTFNTSEDWIGWVRAGETCSIRNDFVWDAQNNKWGVWDTFLIVSNSVNFGAGGYRQCQITAVRL